jgi:hypothetical protein
MEKKAAAELRGVRHRLETRFVETVKDRIMVGEPREVTHLQRERLGPFWQD